MKITKKSSLLVIVAATSSLLTGCLGAPEEGEELGTAEQAVADVDNGLTSNSLTFNSLTFNSLTFNSLTFNSLTFNSLTFNSLINDALADTASRTVLKYIVGCALRADQSVDVTVSGTPYHYDGQVGLYPDWTSGNCPAGTCQPWVSGCVIARLNAAGHVVPLSVRGAALPAADTYEQGAYPVSDAVFFGDIFNTTQKRYACLPAGAALTRTCGGVDPSSCSSVTYLGACSSVCDIHAADGSWQNCWDTPSPHTGGTQYPGSISVFLQPNQPVP